MTGPHDPPLRLRIVVSPGPGRLRLLPPLSFEDGVERIELGQAVARLEQGGGEVLLRAPVAGTVSAVLALEGEPVRQGQAVMVIEPEGR